MSDQKQQSGGQSTSSQAASTSQTSAPNSLANANQGSDNPFEGHDEAVVEGGGEGEAGQQPAVAGQTDGQAKPGEGQPSAGAAQTQVQTPAATPGLTQEAIAEIVAKTVGQSVPAAMQQQQAAEAAKPQFTQEDFVRTFQVFQPTPELLAKIGLPATPEGAATFQNEVVTPIVRQAVTMAAYQMERLKQDLIEHVKQQLQPYEPARALAVERETEKLKTEFFKTNEDLKDFEPLVTEVYARLNAQGTKWKTKDEAFKAIADQARSILKTIPGVQQAMASGQQQQQPETTSNGNGNRMSTLSGGGQGGAALGRQASSAKTTAEELWGSKR